MRVANKIEEARRFFGVVDYPGNLFDILNTEESIQKNKLLLFKQDIDNLSGFISYKNEFIIICINNNRNIGHQNFTLAHEIGHMFLHPGINLSDTNPESKTIDMEREANEFASEFLYPKKYLEEDYQTVINMNFFDQEKWGDFADFINELCIKYCISFKFAFNRLTNPYFRNIRERNMFYERFTKSIGYLSVRFPAHLHIPVRGHYYYQKNTYSFEFLKQKVLHLINQKEIGLETGEAIINKYKILEEN